MGPSQKPINHPLSPHTVARGGGASALARRSAHSEYLGASTGVVSRPCREGIAPLCLKSRMSAAPSRAGNRTLLRKTPFKRERATGFPPAMVRHSFGIETRGAIPSRHGLETTLVDVPRYPECAKRRASALAPPPRLLVRRPLFCPVADEKCVPAHTKR
jgi:hypothetical protein